MEFIESYYPNAKLHEKLDTAASAKLVAEEKMTNAAAIGNLRSGELYGLKTLETGIETNKKNYTRFLILSKHGNPQPREPTKLRYVLKWGISTDRWHGC